MATISQVLFFSLIGGVFSLIGGLLLINNKRFAKALAHVVAPFAAGSLLAAAFFELLPSAAAELTTDSAAQWVLAGIVLFFTLEYFFHWFHHHHEHEPKSTPTPLIIIGDTLHNLLDGIAIGAAFLIDAPTGMVAAIAVAVHEIPQEIGDFGLLLKYGYSKRRIAVINVISALMATVGAVLTFQLGGDADLPIGELLAITAGMFIYVAASDLIPTIHEEAKHKIGHMAALLFVAGIITISLTTMAAHNYIETEDHHHDGPVELHPDDHYYDK